MSGKYWTRTEVIEIFQMETGFLSELEEEEIVCPEELGDACEKRFSEADLERLRLVKLLVQEMGVNLAGAGIILHMRQQMFDMRAQFDQILEDLARNIQRMLHERSNGS